MLLYTARIWPISTSVPNGSFSPLLVYWPFIWNIVVTQLLVNLGPFLTFFQIWKALWSLLESALNLSTGGTQSFLWASAPGHTAWAHGLWNGARALGLLFCWLGCLRLLRCQPVGNPELCRCILSAGEAIDFLQVHRLAPHISFCCPIGYYPVLHLLANWY